MAENLLLACAVSVAVLGSFSASAGAPDVIALKTQFEAESFADPEALHWPGYFWLWNAPLEPVLLREQLRDMAGHQARSVCMLPMPHAFRPDTTNNLMEPDYLTPEFFARVGLAVEEAAALGMHWWLYDEGGWPSGQACGKVTEGHPDFGQHRLVRERVEAKGAYEVPADAVALVVEGTPPTVLRPGETWSPSQPEEAAYVYRVAVGGYADLLNPDVTARFIQLTHEAYKKAIGDHFGKTVRFTFTDEPNAPNLDPGKSITWTPGMDTLHRELFGGSLFEVLPSLFAEPGPDMAVTDARARIDFYELWTSQFRYAYFQRIQNWCHSAGLGSAGHLNGEDQTINAVRYGFGHALRQLRAMDVPGVDLIWRQLFPGRPDQHHFPKFASSAAHQNGTRFALTESFCVYGNGLTPAQMKWLVDYQYIRGLNLFVGGCYPLSTQDHHMTGERPHFGPVNPLWDHLPAFHTYVARLGYALSVGEPKITTALYYPVRDMWAWGQDATEAVMTHDALARELLAHQVDFDLIDDDLLAAPTTRVENGRLVAGAMRYTAVYCGAVCWMHPAALARLRELVSGGGKVFCVGHAPGAEGTPGGNDPPFCLVGDPGELASQLAPTVYLRPATRDIRVAARAVDSGEILALFNEGQTVFDGKALVRTTFAYRLDPETGHKTVLPVQAGWLPIRLEPGESLLLLATDQAHDAEKPKLVTGDALLLDSSITAKPVRRYIVGRRRFVVKTPETEAQRNWWGKDRGRSAGLERAAQWRSWLGEDFSGEVAYTAQFEVPAQWADCPIELQTGPVAYAATVLIDGRQVGSMLWPPWRIELPPCSVGLHELTIRVANTLANELVSERVAKLWAAKSGPGWPSPYHKRALEFESETSGGGIQGPIRLLCLMPPEERSRP